MGGRGNTKYFGLSVGPNHAAAISPIDEKCYVWGYNNLQNRLGLQSKKDDEAARAAPLEIYAMEQVLWQLNERKLAYKAHDGMEVEEPTEEEETEESLQIEEAQEAEEGEGDEEEEEEKAEEEKAGEAGEDGEANPEDVKVEVGEANKTQKSVKSGAGNKSQHSAKNSKSQIQQEGDQTGQLEDASKVSDSKPAAPTDLDVTLNLCDHIN